MSELVVVVVEDEAEVRAEIVRDLGVIGPSVRIDEADDVADARDAIAEAQSSGDVVGLVLADHRLPGETGVDLLVSINHDPALRAIRTVLITGQAGHQDTIRAINEAGLDWYFSKPWDPEELVSIVREQLTSFVIETGLEPLPFVRDLNGPRLLEYYAKRGRPD